MTKSGACRQPGRNRANKTSKARSSSRKLGRLTPRDATMSCWRRNAFSAISLPRERKRPAWAAAGTTDDEARDRVGGRRHRAARARSARFGVRRGARDAAAQSMRTLPPSVHIYLATEPVDLRRGHDGLFAIVRNQWRMDPFAGSTSTLATLSRESEERENRGNREGRGRRSRHFHTTRSSGRFDLAVADSSSGVPRSLMLR